MACNADHVAHPKSVDCWGCCGRNGAIRLKLEGLNGRPRSAVQLEDATLHELAHLNHHNHASGWRLMYGQMKRWLRAERLARGLTPRA